MSSPAKNSLRLALSAIAVGFITLAASGAPLPFLDPLTGAAHAAPTRLLPPGPDGEAVILVPAAPTAAFGAQ